MNKTTGFVRTLLLTLAVLLTLIAVAHAEPAARYTYVLETALGPMTGTAVFLDNLVRLGGGATYPVERDGRLIAIRVNGTWIYGVASADERTIYFLDRYPFPSRTIGVAITGRAGLP